MELITFITFAFLAGADPELQNCRPHDDGTVICEVIKEEYKLGDETLKIVDPAKLLLEAQKKQLGGLRKVNLWKHYEYPPFIKELARQNDMDPQEMIDRLAVQPVDPNPWKALKQLELTYEAAVRAYGRQVVNEAFSKIMDDIISDVLDQIRLTLGSSHV